MANLRQLKSELGKLADKKQADLNKPANLGQVAEIVVAADQEWVNK